MPLRRVAQDQQVSVGVAQQRHRRALEEAAGHDGVDEIAVGQCLEQHVDVFRLPDQTVGCRGAAYCFLPSATAIRYISALGKP